MSRKVYKVLIVEDKPIFSEPLKMRINQDEKFEVMAVTDSVKDAYSLIKIGLPDAVIVDLQLKEGDGCDLLRQIRGAKESLSVQPYVLVTTAFESETLTAMLSSGLVDYAFSKKNLSYSPDEVLKHLRLVSDFFYRNRTPDKQMETTALEREDMIRTRIDSELNQYYMNHGSPGVEYLAELIYQAYHLKKIESVPVMQLYAVVGKKYKATPNAVDNAVRRVINGAFNKTATEDIERLYTPYVDIGRGAPRNKEFIVYVAAKLRSEKL